MLKKRLGYFLSCVFFAWGFFWMTVMIFNAVGGDVLSATIWNCVVIVVFVLEDKYAEYIHPKMTAKYKKKKPNIIQKFGMWYFGSASFKSALYLFYFVMLICFAIVAADPDFPVLRDMSDYFQSLQYGILILFAGDNFLKQLFKEQKHKETYGGETTEDLSTSEQSPSSNTDRM